MDSLRNSRRISGRRSDDRKYVCCSQANVWTFRQRKWPLVEVRLWTFAVFPSQGCNRLKYLDVSWNQLSHTREQLGITRKHVITLTHLDTRNNPWQKVNILITYPQGDQSIQWLLYRVICHRYILESFLKTAVGATLEELSEVSIFLAWVADVI